MKGKFDYEKYAMELPSSTLTQDHKEKFFNKPRLLMHKKLSSTKSNTLSKALLKDELN